MRLVERILQRLKGTTKMKQRDNHLFLMQFWIASSPVKDDVYNTIWITQVHGWWH